VDILIVRAEEPRRATGDRLGADALDVLAEVLFPASTSW